jgi:hypothetical protein
MAYQRCTVLGMTEPADAWGPPPQDPPESLAPDFYLDRGGLKWQGSPELRIGFDPLGAAYHRYGEQFALPLRYVVVVDQEDRDARLELDVEVNAAGETECARLQMFRRAGGRPIDGTGMRDFPIATILKQSRELAAVQYVLIARGSTKNYQMFDSQNVEPGSLGELEQAYAGATKRSPRQGKQLTIGDLRRVADLYREAIQLGHPPKKYVAQKEHVAESTAGRWFVQARKAGFLAPARRGVAGESRKEDE